MLILLAVLGLTVLGIGLVTITVGMTTSGFCSSKNSSTVEAENGLLANPTVLKAQAGTLTTRTNDTSGTITMGSGSHGITTGQRVDIYWDGGSCYGAVVGTVSGTAVPIASVQGGDILPDDESAVTVGIPESSAFVVDGDTISALVLTTGIFGSLIGTFVIEDEDAGAPLLAKVLEANSDYAWTADFGTNPLAEVVAARVWMSHSHTGASVTTMKAAALFT